MNIHNDREMLIRAQTGTQGFGELFDAYYDRIYAFAYRRVGAREVAEDIASAVFEDALRGIKKLFDSFSLMNWIEMKLPRC